MPREFPITGSVVFFSRGSVIRDFPAASSKTPPTLPPKVTPAMTNRQKNGIGCFILALVFAGVAINNTFISPPMPIDDPSGLGASRLVGAFLPAVALLALGLWLFQKPKA